MAGKKGGPFPARAFLVLYIACAVAGCCGERYVPEKDLRALGVPGGWSFVVLGDSRPVSWDSWCVSRKLFRTIARMRPGPELVFDCGDLINSPGNRIHWLLFRTQISPLPRAIRFYPVIGNHDVNDAESERVYTEEFALPGKEIYYSLDYNQAHFIVLDTEVPGQVNAIQGEQLRWLRDDLAAVSTTQPTFVFMHRPLFPVAGYIKDPLKNREELHALFVEHGVKAVFAGHEHLYSRTVRDGISYIITGGGGAHLIRGQAGSWHHMVVVSLRGSGFLIQVMDKDGRIRDEVRG